MPHSFQCVACGHLHHSDHAGEAPHPHACVACGAGVRFSERGVKIIDAANWKILAEAEPGHIHALGLTASHVEKHVPMTAEEGHRRNLERIEKDLKDLAELEAKGELTARQKEHKLELMIGQMRSSARTGPPKNISVGAAENLTKQDVAGAKS